VGFGKHSFAEKINYYLEGGQEEFSKKGKGRNYCIGKEIL